MPDLVWHDREKNMKAIGVKQLQQKKFDLRDLEGSVFKDLLGSVPMYFTCVIYGYSGNGKTELAIQLAKELATEEKLAWISYEQGHGYDLQMAVNRNHMEDVSGRFIPIDPHAKTEESSPDGFLEEVVDYLKKRNSPKHVVIDSLDYTGWRWEHYKVLKERFGNKKSLIFLAHGSKTGKPLKRITEQIIFDGGMGIWVHQYIARPEKNRFGGFTPYVIWEERARELNPAFFGKKRRGKSGAGVPQMTLELGGSSAVKGAEGMGVRAEDEPKKEAK